jgi:hypothetical protein
MSTASVSTVGSSVPQSTVASHFSKGSRLQNSAHRRVLVVPSLQNQSFAKISIGRFVGSPLC